VRASEEVGRKLDHGGACHRKTAGRVQASRIAYGRLAPRITAAICPP